MVTTLEELIRLTHQAVFGCEERCWYIYVSKLGPCALKRARGGAYQAANALYRGQYVGLTGKVGAPYRDAAEA